VLQFLVSPLLLWKSFLSATISCALYAVALSYYHYLNFLGYSALPFLERTEVGGFVHGVEEGVSCAYVFWCWC
jgi:hypothetical protein